jgi:hypothetical protein
MVFLIILVLSFLLQLFAPWWMIVLSAFITCAVFAKSGKIALWQSFFAILFLWLGMALFHTIPNEHLLASRVGAMLMVNSWLLVLILTGILGGFVAAISGFCGFHFRKALQTEQGRPTAVKEEEPLEVHKS